MSMEANVWAWTKIADLGPTPAFITLFRLADQANMNGEVLPVSVGEMAADLACEPRTVNRHLAKLEALGLLTRYETNGGDGRRAANRYVLPIKPNVEPSPDRSDRGVKTDRGLVVVPTSQGERLNEQRTTEGTSGPTTPKCQIDKRKLADEEWALAERIMARFNVKNEAADTGKYHELRLLDSRGRPTENLKRIVMVLRSDPDLEPDDHKRIIDATFANPWWPEGGRAGSVSVIYSPGTWSRAKVNKGRPTGKKRFRGERRTDPEDSPW